MSKDIPVLLFIEGGIIPGIPARDLYENELKQYGGKQALIDTGRYEENPLCTQAQTKFKSAGKQLQAQK